MDRKTFKPTRSFLNTFQLMFFTLQIFAGLIIHNTKDIPKVPYTQNNKKCLSYTNGRFILNSFHNYREVLKLNVTYRSGKKKIRHARFTHPSAEHYYLIKYSKEFGKLIKLTIIELV